MQVVPLLEELLEDDEPEPAFEPGEQADGLQGIFSDLLDQ